MPEKQIFEDFSKTARSTKIDHGLISTGRFPPVNGLCAELNLLEHQRFPLKNFLKIFVTIIVLENGSTVALNLKPQVGVSETEGIFYSLLAECYVMNDIQVTWCNKTKTA